MDFYSGIYRYRLSILQSINIQMKCVTALPRERSEYPQVYSLTPLLYIMYCFTINSTNVYRIFVVFVICLPIDFLENFAELYEQEHLSIQLVQFDHLLYCLAF
jgi:hypothetical protein